MSGPSAGPDEMSNYTCRAVPGHGRIHSRTRPDPTLEANTVKFRVERDVLADAVAWAARSLPVRPSVPILAGLLVRATADEGDCGP